MGLLDHLWDDTLAGPRPESGLSKLRRASSAVTSESEEFVPKVKDISKAEAETPRQVSQSITILKPGSAYQRSLSLSVDTSANSEASSPSLSACSTPTSPATPRENIWQAIKSGGAKPESKKRPKAEPRAPTVYDWVVITALDR